MTNSAIPPAFESPAEKKLVTMDQNDSYIVPEDVDCIRVIVEWTSKSFGMVCDLDLKVYFFDERARFIEKLDVSSAHRSRDGSCVLHGDVEVASLANQYFEVVKINLDKIDPATTAIMFYIDGGPRNFQFVSTVSLLCNSTPADRNEGSFLPTHETANSMVPLFTMSCRSKKDFQGIAMASLYKDGWGSNQKPRWISRAIVEPVFVSTEKGKEDKCTHLVINIVPSLEKFRPRMFANVRDLCQALSSRSLPRLKNKFMKSTGLGLQEFTEVIFKQLYETHPKIIEDTEAPYTVAMIEEMFFQIDDSNDGTADWDEFTTFCVQIGLTQPGKSGTAGEKASITALDEYVIEYGEDVLMRDHVLASHRYISMVRHITDNKRFLVIPEDSDHIIVMDEEFRLISQLFPYKVQIVGGAMTKKQLEAANAAQPPGAGSRTVVYDITYLAGKEMYAFSASDHSITVCKEQISMGGKKVTYTLHNRIYHSLLHLKLCWSPRFKLLCSVASDRVIYGWDIDGPSPIFQISRHSDLITDFIAIDNLELFATCSMDHRIVLWSAQTRRVRGILLGHKMGVRTLSHYESTLLSAGFECDARTWDLVTKDPVAILRGHRFPVAAAKLMCDRAQSEKEHRAITVDESGEFRLWNIYVKERSTDPTLVPTIQIFEMQSPEVPLNRFRFIAIPNNPQLSTSYYSDMVACSTKMMRFLPEKNAKEFLPPTACIFHDSSAFIVTAVGKTMLKYDMCTGAFVSSYPDLSGADVTAICPDGGKGHRMMVGCGKGELLMINFMTGLILDRVNVHAREITSVLAHHGRRNMIYTSSLDGKIGVIEEAAGQLHLHNTIEGVFEKLMVAQLKHVPTLKALIAVSTGAKWCILHDATLKKLVTIEEGSIVNAIEVLGASRDKEDLQHLEKIKDTTSASMLTRRAKEHLVTFAVALANGINIYTYDTMDLLGIQTFRLLHDRQVYITDMHMLRAPDENCVNYSTTRQHGPGQLGPQLVVTTDDGYIITWDLKSLRQRSEDKFRRKFSPIAKQSMGVGVGEIRSQMSSGSLLSAGHGLGEVVGGGDEEYHDDADDDASETSSIATGAGSIHSPGRAVRMDISAINGSGAGNSPTKLPFLTSLSEGEGGAGKAEEGSETSSTSPKRMQLPTSLKSIQNKSLNSSAMRAANRRHSANNAHVSRDGSVPASSVFGPPVGKHGIIEYMSRREWIGHNDSINLLVPLHDHGCIVTVSLDGFHRVWNIDKDCLGEFPLPNLLEKMKNPRIRVVKVDGYKFILERIPVTQRHKETASNLVIAVQRRGKVSVDVLPPKNAASRTLQEPSMFSLDRSMMDLSLDEKAMQSQFRSQLLRSLNRPSPLPNDVPPARVLSKGELKLVVFQRESELSTNSPKSRTMSPSTGGRRRSSVKVLTLGSPTLSTVGGGAATGSAEPYGRRLSSAFSMTPSRAQSPSGHSGKDSTAKPPSRARSPLLAGSLLEHSTSTYKTAERLSSVTGGPLSEAMWLAPEELTGGVNFSIPAAFSEKSLCFSSNDGNIDGEAMRMLRQVARQPDKLSVYERSQGQLLLRNISLSSSVEVPSLASVHKNEVTFGAQKGMYKNANKILMERDDSINKHHMQHSIALGRIERNVRKINTMIHILPPPSHDEVILPPAEGESGLSSSLPNPRRSSITPSRYATSFDDVGPMGSLHRSLSSVSQDMEQAAKSQYRLMQSSASVSAEAAARARPLDREGISKLVEKFDRALESAPGLDREEAASRLRLKSHASRHKKKKADPSAGAEPLRDLVEKKLQNAIKSKYRESFQGEDKGDGTSGSGYDLSKALEIRMSSLQNLAQNGKTKALTTRALLPFYRLEDVKAFVDLFAKVDTDFSGDLDMDEWVKLFSSLRKNVNPNEARSIFLKMDKSGDNLVAIPELVPILFNQANKEQQGLITNFALSFLNRQHERVTKLTHGEVDQLFDAYDVENVSFVSMAYLRERIKAMPLPESVIYFFLSSIADMEDDEMVNHVEFSRIMKPYTIAKPK